MALTLFGTDGIRGRANHYPLTPEMTVRIGWAVGRFFFRPNARSSIIVGRDTRISGPMLEAAMSAGICAAGTDVRQAGMLPTPAISFLTRKHGAAAGVVISASHNPYEDNGIKVFGPDGYKLSVAQEAEIEAMILAAADDDERRREKPIGIVDRIEGASEDYLAFLRGAMPDHFSLNGSRIVIDCANGATSNIARTLLETWGPALVVLFDQPDGININRGCGSEHTDTLRQQVIEEKADLGLAFDGDGDRMIAVDETGRILAGDQILAIGARFLKGQGQLTNNRVISTVMSNLGLKKALQAMGIEHETCRVGDRFVMEAMRKSGAVLGGEDSGHMIYFQHHRTGDGLISALKLLEAMQRYKRPLSELGRMMTPYPQILENVPVREKPDLKAIKDIQQVIEAVEMRLGERGRVLVRYSGTQSICRVMVEGPDEREVGACCHAVAEAVAKAIGA
ncbi:MAG: phosphoglucosamine mutase [Desulfobacterales bacterium]|nr:phosphoglucosamine mutase [Desulfobacterales bacterium]